MQHVNLHTRDGSFVQTVRIPQHRRLPEVLLWGDRVFILRDDEYREATGYLVLSSEVVPPEEAAGT